MTAIPLRLAAARGIRWTGFASVATASLALLQLIVLTRLLKPEDFGLVGMMTVFITFAQAFADLGFSNAIIHRPDPSREQLSTLYCANLLAGIAIYALFVLGAPWIARFYSEPRLHPLLLWMALSFVITPLGQQFQVLMQKQLDFNRFAKVEVATALLSTLIAIAAAIAGQGVYALVWAHLAAALTRAGLLIALEWSHWRPTLRLRYSELRGYLGFGLYQIGERGFNHLATNVDYLIIGRFLGPELLGYYVLAYQLVTTPFLRINPILTRVAFPVFALRQSDDALLRRGYLDMIRLLALVLFPILVGLGLTAPLLVAGIFGASWQPSIPLIQILVLLGLTKGLLNPSGTILLAKGRADIGFLWNLLVMTVNTVVFLSTVRFGITTLAWAHAGLCAVYLMIGLGILRSLIALSFREFAANLVRPLLTSLGMALVVLACLRYLGPRGLDPAAALAISALTGAAAYAAILFALERKFLADQWRLLVSSRAP